MRWSRVLQLVGVIFCAGAIALAATGTYGSGAAFLVGFGLIIGGRAYEWVKKDPP